MSADRIQFTDETSSNRLSTYEPACIRDKKDSQKLSFGAPVLNDEEAVPAKEALLNKSFINLDFPKKLRMRVDPALPQQNFCLFTFTPSKGAAPDADGCFGVIKQRGNFATDRDADEWGEHIIRTVDSINENLIGRVGQDFPLTMENKYCEQTKEVDIRMKMDDIARGKVKAQRDQDKKEMDEIQSRQKELLADTSEKKEVSFDDIEYYTQLRVKRGNIRTLQEECQKKMKECSKILDKTNKEIHSLDDKHPSFEKEYESKYKAALDSVGGTGSEQSKKMIDAMR